MKIGAQGQIIIPKQLREKYGLLPNVEVEFITDAECLQIKRKTGHVKALRAVYGILRKRKASIDTYIEEIRGR